jgi:hypothetical protein
MADTLGESFFKLTKVMRPPRRSIVENSHHHLTVPWGAGKSHVKRLGVAAGYTGKLKNGEAKRPRPRHAKQYGYEKARSSVHDDIWRSLIHRLNVNNGMPVRKKNHAPAATTRGRNGFVPINPKLE